MIKFKDGQIVIDNSDMGIENTQGQLVVDINDNGIGIWLSEDHRCPI
jgi:hypothetical protein